MRFKDTEYGDLTNKEYYSSIRIRYSNLTSLEGSPEKINGNFDCSNNDLKTLKHSPKIVYGSFFCNHNNLTSLENNKR